MIEYLWSNFKNKAKAVWGYFNFQMVALQFFCQIHLFQKIIFYWRQINNLSIGEVLRFFFYNSCWQIQCPNSIFNILSRAMLISFWVHDGTNW